MKKLILLSAIALLIFATSCEKEEQRGNKLRCPPTSIVKGNEHDIIGKWKLVQAFKRVEFGAIDSIDVSCDNVYFEFKNDSVLQVLGNSNILKKGIYKYSYHKPMEEDSLSLPGPNLHLKNNSSFCFVKPSKMRILQHFGNTSIAEFFIRTK